MDWTVVRHKRSSSSATRAHHVSSKPSAAFHHLSSPGPEKKLAPEHDVKADLSRENFDEIEVERLISKVQRAIAKVEQSIFFSRFMKQLQDLGVVENLSRSWKSGRSLKVGQSEVGEDTNSDSTDEDSDADKQEHSLGSTVELVVYGVGSISNSEISRCQLSLALLLKRRLGAIGDVLVYDPIISGSESCVMLNLGCILLENNEEGRRPLSGPSLFYMPHCDVELYESILQANLKPSNVGQFVILGNSFRIYQNRWSVYPLPQGERPACLLKVQECVDEIPVPDCFSPAAFNDTSWHFFSKVKGLELL